MSKTVFMRAIAAVAFAMAAHAHAGSLQVSPIRVDLSAEQPAAVMSCTIAAISRSPRKSAYSAGRRRSTRIISTTRKASSRARR
ncbi:hypothetical protein [Candidatus Burkholderia verschuerenii]|uniref:hypothetical protein n=1 Tax=Candidatus Burkholderia verschuerenii TaxID=242163 RepID=UPI000B16884A|nr:hypothetical protein [Candidatus Burkholderia verschuerenii]